MTEKSSIHLPGWAQQNTTGAKASFISMAQPAKKPIADEVARLIQNRANGIDPPDIFGAIDDVNAIGHESLLPALAKAPMPTQPLTVRIGSSQCRQPYEASLLNCSALSFGPMSKPFITALNQAAFRGSFYQNTGEAGLSPYHLGVDVDIDADGFDAESFFQHMALNGVDTMKQAGDAVWQIGNGYFGCRKPDGSFDPEQFRIKTSLSPIKMIEVKLSQGVEPWARMPVKEVTPGIAKLLGVDLAKQAILQNRHAEFNSPVELLHFVQQLRTLSGGKPIGLKMGVSHRHYILALCKAMRKTGILLDFITVDGMEGGTAAAQPGSLGFTGTALNDAVVFVHNALTGTRLRHEVRIIASGKVFTERDMIHKLARGADLCATARGMMLAVGCDQQLKCNQGTCTQGIATQDPRFLANFNTQHNAERLYQYHQRTLNGLYSLLAIAGLTHADQLRPFHLQKRVNYADVLPLDEVYDFLKPGALLTWFPWALPKRYKRHWQMADPYAPF